MPTRDLNAIIDEAQEWGDTQWWRLELRSFDDAPRAQHALAPLGPKEAWSKEIGRSSFGGCLQTIAYVVGLTAPAVGAAGMLNWLVGGGYGDMPLIGVGWLTLVALLVTVYSEIRGRMYPRAVSASALFSTTLVRIIPAVVTLLVAFTAGGGPGGDGFSWWSALIVAVDLAVNVVILVRGLTPSRNRPADPIENVQRSVDELSDSVRTDLRARRDAAITEVQRRGLIDAATADRAKRCALGTLAMTMAPDARSNYYPASKERGQQSR